MAAYVKTTRSLQVFTHFVSHAYTVEPSPVSEGHPRQPLH